METRALSEKAWDFKLELRESLRAAAWRNQASTKGLDDK